MNQSSGNETKNPFNSNGAVNNGEGPQIASRNVNFGDKGNVLNNPEQAINDAHRNRANEGLARADSKGKRPGGLGQPNRANGGGGAPGNNPQNNYPAGNNSGLNSPAGQQNQKNLQNNIQTAKQYAKQKAAEQAIKKTAMAAGIPEPVTDKALKTKKGQQMLQNLIDTKKKKGNIPAALKKGASMMPGLPGMIGKAANAVDKKNEEESDSKEKELKEKNEAASGDISFEVDKKTLKRIVIFTPVAVMLLSFFVIIMAMISNDLVSGVIVGQMSSKGDKEEIKKGHKQVKDDMGEVEIDSSDFSDSGNGRGNGSSLGKGGNLDGFPAEYKERFRNLGNSFSSKLECKNEKCYERPEFKYYVKIADIATRYREKYNVTLDWYLITSTNLFFSDTQEERMTKNLGGYNENDIKNTSSVMSLDWDYDYKNINGYQYLDASDSKYDLQILAKNMVKKKTTQTCTDSNGNTTKTQEDEDVEDVYFQSGGNKRLDCGSDSYSINSTYTVDMNKYKEFMLEYIDKKMQSPGSGNSSNNNSNNNCITSGDKYIWPIGSKETTTSDGKTFALGTPESVTITSYFGSQESFRNSGHGAVDIGSNGQGPGNINVIAAKGGKVVYPTNKSQTSYEDNGHLGSTDGYGYGNYIIIDHGDGLFTLYGHLSKNTIKVMAGENVSQGQVIAKMGNSGNSTGTHLHFEMRKGANSSSNRVDPLGYVDPKDPRLGVSKTSCSGVDGMGSAVVNLAVSQQNDPEAVNGKKYWSYLGFTSRIEWCACFVSWVLNNAEYNGKKLNQKINFKSASVAQWMNYFYNTNGLEFKYNDNCSKFAGKNGSGTYTPKPGDVIFFDWDNSFGGTMPVGFEDHIGLVQKVENGKIITIEGNASNSVRSNTFPINSCNVIGFGSWY